MEREKINVVGKRESWRERERERNLCFWVERNRIESFRLCRMKPSVERYNVQAFDEFERLFEGQAVSASRIARERERVKKRTDNWSTVPSTPLLLLLLHRILRGFYPLSLEK